MHVVVPAAPVGPLTDAWRICVGTGRTSLALRHDDTESGTDRDLRPPQGPG